MMPMGFISTQLISYREINVKDLDLIEDAWGLNARFNDVISVLRQLDTIPENNLTDKLIDKIRKHH
jgi:hypothetical protein